MSEKNKTTIWRTHCPSCKTGLVLLFQKGGQGKCDQCDKTFYTEYQEHGELDCKQTEYWLMD